MSSQIHISQLANGFAAHTVLAETAEEFYDLATQATNIAFLCREEARRLSNPAECSHSRYKVTQSGWGSIECELCGKYGVIRDKKPDFEG